MLSIDNRLFENLLCRRLIKFVDKNDILNDLRYGTFPNKHSTQNMILDIVNSIHSDLLDKRKYSCGILFFIDVKNAFDTVNHEILLAKLLELWNKRSYKFLV